MNNIIINWIIAIGAIYIIYMLYLDYLYQANNRDNFILEVADFEDNLNKYGNSKLFEIYKSLPPEDKLFLDDYINYIRTKDRKTKPRFNKKMKSLTDNILLAAITANIGSFTAFSAINTLKSNTLHHFTSSLI